MTPVESNEEDLTRKQKREQARAERKAMEEAEAASALRRKRLTTLGIAAAVVVVAIVVIAVAAGSGGGSKKVASGSPEAKATAATVETTVGGISQTSNTLGNPNAPVTLVYYGDLECPICRDFTLGAFPAIVQKWVRTGKVKVEYRSLETATREPEVFKAQQIAALAAGKQGKMWQYLELFYHEQKEEGSGYATEAFFQEIARQVPGLNFQQWMNDRNNAAYANQVATDQQAATNAGYNGTPTFEIGKTGGALKKLEYQSLTESTSFDQAIEELLKG